MTIDKDKVVEAANKRLEEARQARAKPEIRLEAHQKSADERSQDSQRRAGKFTQKQARAKAQKAGKKQGCAACTTPSTRGVHTCTPPVVQPCTSPGLVGSWGDLSQDLQDTLRIVHTMHENADYVTQSNLSENLGVERTTGGRRLKKLVDGGWVNKVNDLGTYVYELTDKAIEGAPLNTCTPQGVQDDWGSVAPVHTPGRERVVRGHHIQAMLTFANKPRADALAATGWSKDDGLNWVRWSGREYRGCAVQIHPEKMKVHISNVPATSAAEAQQRAGIIVQAIAEDFMLEYRGVTFESVAHMDCVTKGRKWRNQKVALKFVSGEYALEGDAFAKKMHENRYSVKTERYDFDASKLDPELETVHRETAVEDLDKYLEHIDRVMDGDYAAMPDVVAQTAAVLASMALAMKSERSRMSQLTDMVTSHVGGQVLEKTMGEAGLVREFAQQMRANISGPEPSEAGVDSYCW